MLLNLSLLGSLGLVGLAAAKCIEIDVGDNGQLVISPNSVTADVGDNIVFNVYAGHTVTQADGFTHPCQFKPGGFFSGPAAISKAQFAIEVTDTNPIWFYCSTITHCQIGMVGVINP